MKASGVRTSHTLQATHSNLASRNTKIDKSTLLKAIGNELQDYALQDVFSLTSTEKIANIMEARVKVILDLKVKLTSTSNSSSQITEEMTICAILQKLYLQDNPYFVVNNISTSFTLAITMIIMRIYDVQLTGNVKGNIYDICKQRTPDGGGSE